MYAVSSSPTVPIGLRLELRTVYIRGHYPLLGCPWRIAGSKLHRRPGRPPPPIPDCGREKLLPETLNNVVLSSKAPYVSTTSYFGMPHGVLRKHRSMSPRLIS